MDKESLKDRCLQVIVENLQHFSYAYNTSEDPELKRNFEFLQRCYSNEMLQLVSGVDSADEACISLLINKYVTELDLKILNGFDEETTVKIISIIGEGLNKLSFSNQFSDQFKYQFTAIFPHLKQLSVLKIYHACNDEALENIAKYCPHLVELNIKEGRFTNSGFIQFLCQKNGNNDVPNSNLRKLCISGTTVEDDTITIILTSFQHLEILEHSRLPCVLHDMHWNDLVQNNLCHVRKYKLTCLDLWSCEHLKSASDIVRLYTVLCPDLSHFSSRLANADQLKALGNCTKLTQLPYFESWVSRSPYPSANSFLCGRGAGLTILNLSRFCISVEDLVNYCPLLEELNLQEISFTPLAGTTLKELTFLKSLHLFEIKDGTESVNILLSCAPKLENIILNCVRLNDKLETGLIRCCARSPLKSISFYTLDCNLSLLRNILINATALKSLDLDVIPPANSDLNFDIYDLVKIASQTLNKPELCITKFYLFSFARFDYKEGLYCIDSEY